LGAPTSPYVVQIKPVILLGCHWNGSNKRHLAVAFYYHLRGLGFADLLVLSQSKTFIEMVTLSD